MTFGKGMRIGNFSMHSAITTLRSNVVGDQGGWFLAQEAHKQLWPLWEDQGPQEE